MKLQIISDLHLEFGAIELPIVERDVLILAGDIHIGKKANKFIRTQLKYSPVIYVLGNHEFYNNYYENVKRYWMNFKEEGFYFLHNQSIILQDFGNIRFLGSTLWTDFNFHDANAMQEAREKMTDFKTIRFYNHIFTPEDAADLFLRAGRFLSIQLHYKPPEIEKTVVITHHSPSLKSIAAEYGNSLLNYAFASDLDKLIKNTEPILWIHGHTHESFDYSLGSTRIICNPRGYAGVEENPSFRPDFVIEI